MTGEQQAIGHITLALHGYFSRAYAGGQRPTIVPLADGDTARAIVSRMAIPPGAIGLALINGAQASLDTPLHDGDRLDILPLLGGG